MGTDHFTESGCLIPVVTLLKSQLPEPKAKKTKDAKPSTTARQDSRPGASSFDGRQLAALVAFCEKVNKCAKKEKCKTLLDAEEGHLNDILKVGVAVLTGCEVPIRVEYQAVGRYADGSRFIATEATAAAAKAAIETQTPKCILEKVTELYFGGEGRLLCMDFVHPDCGYDDFFGDQQLYFRVAEKALWISPSRPKKALKCLAEQLGVAPDALAPVTWVSILY